MSYSPNEKRNLKLVTYYTTAKKTTTTTATKTYIRPTASAYFYKPTVYAATSTYKPISLSLPTISIGTYVAPKIYVPPVYIPPVYIATTSYYKPTTVALLNIGQTCSSNVGCLSGCCKTDTYGWKSCSSSISCSTTLISSNTYYVYKANVKAAGAAGGAMLIIMICLPCIIVGCLIWCCCKCCKNDPQTVIVVQGGQE